MCLGPTRLEHRNEEFSEDPETRFTAVSWPMRLAFASGVACAASGM